MITSMMSLIKEKKVFGFLIRTILLILLVLTTCTCSGPRLMLGNQTLGNQTDYSLYSGKLARPILDPMGCATLRTVDLDFLSCHQLKLLILQQYPLIHGSVYCPNLDKMLRRCSLTRWYQSLLIIRSSSNPYRTEWTVQRPSLPTGYRPRNLPGDDSIPRIDPSKKPLKVWTRPSTGRTRVITPTMGRNSSSSSTMNRGSGKGRTTSSTTGGLRKPPLD